MLAWGILLLAAAIVAIIIEVVAPSGIIAAVSVLLAIAGIVCLFRESVLSGLSGALATIVLLPTIFFVGLRIIPSTPVGRQMLFGESGRHQPVIPESAGRELEALLGAEGEALTDLRPVGTARIEGERIDVRSEVVFIPKGTRIRVSGIEGSQVKVRPVA